ncbi:MAG: CRISPR-associated protein Cas5 [Bryobacteraceae bacterium]|jgi:CRISPR-associated protein Cas5d
MATITDVLTKNYEVEMEIAGPAAMWTRPDTGSAAVSGPGPTFSAAKGMFEAIARLKSAYIRPTRVEICKPIQFDRYVTNYGGPLRKSNQVRGGDSYQLPAVILVDVCYRLYGVVEEVTGPPNSTNHLHALQEMFLRRLAKGQWFRCPCLGWKEFVPSYVGPFRPDTAVETGVDLVIPSMLHAVFDQPVNGKVSPTFRQNVPIRRGVLEYAV